MNEAARNAVVEALENLANQESWNAAAWQKCFNLVTANWDDELMKFVNHDLILYDELFHPRHILGFRLKPDFQRLADYRRDFRAVATDLRTHLSLGEAKKQYGL